MRKHFYAVASLLILLFAVISLGVSAQELKSKKADNGKYGYIDKSGTFVIEPQYDIAFSFSEGLARVILDGKGRLLDHKSGKDFIAPQYYTRAVAYIVTSKLDDSSKVGYINKGGEVIIEFKYYFAGDFSEGLALVYLDGKFGFIDIAGNFYSGRNDKDREKIEAIIAQKAAAGEYDEIKNRITNSFSYFAQNYVQQRINKWQKKGEFEKISDWQQRVNEESREQKAIEFTKEAEQEYFAERGSTHLVLGAYDAENQVFLFKDSEFGNLLVPVPIDKAESFKTNWKSYTIKPKFFTDNDQLGLAEVTFTSKINPQDQFKYSNSASLNYAVANVSYNFDPIEVNLAGATGASATGVQSFASKTLTVGKSDVDMDIPVTDVVNKNTFAVIISNENYRKVAPVAMSLNDGKVFKEYCHKTLGLPENNVRFYKDATYGDLLGAINDIKNISEAYDGAIDIIFYYSGHGFPHETTRDAYLLPVDGSSSQVEISYPLSKLYSELNLMKAQHVTIFLDACFSGSQRDGAMLASARGIALKPKMASPLNENMVVFSAASDDQTAFPYKTKNHGIFTYYLLKKLKETKGEVTLGELGDYIITNVKQSSVVENKKLQTPTVSALSTRYLVPTK